MSSGKDGVGVDVQEHVSQEVIGYSPDCGYLIRGRRQDMGQLVSLGRDDLAQVELADAVDQQVFGVDGHPVVVVVPRYSGNVKRYLAPYSWFRFGVAAAAAQNGGGGHE